MIDRRSVGWRTIGVVLIGCILLYRAILAEPFGEPNPGLDFNFWVGTALFALMCLILARQAAKETP